MITYDKPIKKISTDRTLGYCYFMDKEHPLANKIGKVYYHRHVLSLSIGRWMKPDEIAHHIDENRSNNKSENLILTNSSDHGKHHHPVEDKEVNCAFCGNLFLRLASTPKRKRRFCSNECLSRYNKINGKPKKPRKIRESRKVECELCGKMFPPKTKSKRRFCSQACREKSNFTRKFLVTREELHHAVWSMSTTKVAKKYGVSDKAIEKRCKKLKIEKPPRGYWAKVEFGHIKPVILPLTPPPTTPIDIPKNPAIL